MEPVQHDSQANSNRVWFITGASSGLGRALAEAVLDRGERAVVTARKPERLLEFIERYPAQALVMELDVTRPDQAHDVVGHTMERFGRIDVLVNSAGYGVLGAIAELDLCQVRRQFETNLFGLLTVTRTVLPIMRRARSGRIVNVSSVGVVRGTPGSSTDHASNFAVEGFSEALAQEVAALGITVTIVERLRVSSLDGQHKGDAARGADDIIQAIDAPRPPLRLALGADALRVAFPQKYAATERGMGDAPAG